MANKITILNEKEKELLRKANNVNAYDIYFHLKDDENYFKGEFYDLTRCMAEYLNMSYDMVKRGLKKLKDVGLVETTKRGKVNIYTLPYNRKNIKTDDREQNNDFQDTSEEVKEPLNREEQQKGKTLNRGSERDNGQYDERGTGEKEISNFNEDETEETESYKNFEEPTDFIADNINRVLIPYLQKNGTRYYEEIDSLTKEALGRYPQLMKFDVMGMIEDALTRNKMKQTN